MHPSVMTWVADVVASHGLNAGNVIEIGSYDVNGTVRPLFDRAELYWGTDIREGPGVDEVLDIEDTVNVITFDQPKWDTVVSTEMLEHTPHPWVAVWHMGLLLRPGGHLVLTTRGPGFGIHDFPGDFFRFTAPAMRLLVEEGGLQVVELADDPEYPGVFVLAKR